MNAEELREAENAAMAALLTLSECGDVLVCDALGSDPWAEREIQNALQVAWEVGAEPDECAIGRAVAAAMRRFVRSLPDFGSEVDRQIRLIREDRAEQARADDEFEASY